MNGRKVKHARSTKQTKNYNVKNYTSKRRSGIQRYKKWQAPGAPFRCAQCRHLICLSDGIGTLHRNHCPFCLWSLHVDTKTGNRASSCHGRMEPVGLTFKHNGFDKYDRPRVGDVMLVHFCKACGTININRIAGDDCTDRIFSVFGNQQRLASSVTRKIGEMGICLMGAKDVERLNVAILGRS